MDPDIAGNADDAPADLHPLAVSAASGISGVVLRIVLRLGLASRAAVYLLVGYLALRLAVSPGPRLSDPASASGAVQQAAAQSWGRATLVLLAAGFAAYALLQLIEAVFRPAFAKGSMRAWHQRAVSTWGFLLYSAFFVSTVLVIGHAHRPVTSQTEQRQDVTHITSVLRTTPGRLLVVAAGILVVITGAELGRRSVRLSFRERFRYYDRHQASVGLTRGLGAVGCAARGAVFVLIGFFLIDAGVQSNARKVRGIDAVFRLVLSVPAGRWMVGVLALGLVCYGLYCLLEAGYRDLTPGR
jgi:Domain of Unknown Function (DUF1206)